MNRNLKTASGSPTRRTPPNHKTEQRCPIFYLDDDWDDLNIFGDVCRELGHEVMLFDSADKMLHALEHRIPCALFCDVNMTLSSGFEVTREFKVHPEYKDIRIIIYSDITDREEIKRLMALGADYFLNKKMSYGEIREAVKEALQQLNITADGK